MSTELHPTDTLAPAAAVALPTLPTRTRVLDGLGIAAHPRSR